MAKSKAAPAASTTQPEAKPPAQTAEATKPLQQAPDPASAPLARRIPIPRMNVDQLEEFCKADPKRAAETIRSLVALNTGEMPNTVFVRRGPDQLLRRVRSCIVLSKARKELIDAPTKRWDPQKNHMVHAKSWDVTALGYRRLNSIAGLHVVAPDMVVVNDQRQPNPYVETDKKGKPVRAFCRKFAIGSSPATGTLVATDVTVRLDLSLYFIEALNARLRRGGGGDDDDDVGQGAQRGRRPEEPVENYIRYGEEGKPPADGWKFETVLGGTDVGIWYNLGHKAVHRIIGEQVSRLKYVDRISQTLAERNAMKGHPAMPASISDAADDGTYAIDMIGWVSDNVMKDIEKLRAAVSANRLHEEIEVHAHTIDMSEGAVGADIADANEEIGQATADQASIAEDATPSADDSGLPTDRAQLIEMALARNTKLMNVRGAQKAIEALGQAGIAEIDTAAPGQLRAYLKATE